MKDFIKNYIDIFDDMGTSTEEKIEAVIDVYAALKDKDAEGIYNIIIKPLLIEHRDTTDNATIEEVEDLFKQLLQVIL